MILNAYERMIAKRYLVPVKGERFIFVVAGFSVGAVALGVAALIIVGAVVVSKRRGTAIADSPAETVSNGAA